MEFKLLGRHICVRKEVVFVAAVFLLVVLGLVGYIIVGTNGGIIIEAGGSNRALASGEEPPSSQEGSDEYFREISAEKKETEKIKVYVVGCVKNPGIVELEKGQLIDDAIKAAGGATDDADLENINLVYRLNDNVMLHIYPKNGAKPQSGGSEAGEGIRIIRDSGGAVVNESDVNSTINAKININTASLRELDTLPGIGEATAKEIISYREKSGPFKTIQDIMKVPGIKENKFNTIKDYITVD